MKAKGIFISALLVVDTFLMSYAAGFHSRHVLVVNPKLPPVVQKQLEKPSVPAATAKTATKNAPETGKHSGKTDKHGAKSKTGKDHDKGEHKQPSSDAKSAKSDKATDPKATSKVPAKHASTDAKAPAKKSNSTSPKNSQGT